MRPQDEVLDWVARHNFCQEWRVYRETGDPACCLQALGQLRDAGIIEPQKYTELRLELREQPPLRRTKKDPAKTYRDQRIIQIISFLEGKPRQPKTPAPNTNGLDQESALRLAREWLELIEKEGPRPPATVDDVIRDVILRDFPGLNGATVRRMWFRHKCRLRRERSEIDPILGRPMRSIRFGVPRQIVAET